MKLNFTGITKHIDEMFLISLDLKNVYNEK